MKTAIIIALISLLVAKDAVCGNNDDGITLKDLPQAVLQEFMVLLRGQSLVETVECENPGPNDFDMWLYTRENQYDPVRLDYKSSNHQIDSDKRVIVITHGWIQNGKGYGMQELKDAYLKRYDSNVIVVNWQKLAWDAYTQAVCKLPKIGKLIARYLCQVSNENDLDLANVQLVGHSLGGQISGFIGQYTQQTCGKRIGRITGLDPAGPLYKNAPITSRLDKTDADFVDVIHTNNEVFGYTDSCGHADFYVNCGFYQPSCAIPEPNLNGLLNLPVTAVGCSHMRAVDYMIEAVTSNNFKATKCDYCPMACPPVISMLRNSQKAIMGQQCSPDTRGKYFVPTDVKSPYAITTQYGF